MDQPRGHQRNQAMPKNWFSRWFCPSCHQKNVQTSAQFIAEHVLAPPPHRYYVLAIPKMLRAYYQHHRYLLKDLCRLAQESLVEYQQGVLQKVAGCHPQSLEKGSGLRLVHLFSCSVARQVTSRFWNFPCRT
jgi:hypothetical protein